MPDLPDLPTLTNFQRYVEALEGERGFVCQTAIEKCLLLGEEVGELFKAVRKAQQIAIDPTSDITTVGEELADIFIYLCAIANRYGIDLETAFRAKEEVNKRRHWRPEQTV